MATTTTGDTHAANHQKPANLPDQDRVTDRHQVVIVGGGTAGLTVAAQLTKGWFNHTDVAVIDPSDKHYYQPAFTLVGAGTFRKADTVRNEADVMPRKAKWIRDAVVRFDPDKNHVYTRSGKVIEYQYLIVAAGIQINWDGIPGLKESIGKGGVCSNYSFDTVDSTWQALQNFQGGTAIFTHPLGAVKCGGAPQKIAYLADDYFRQRGVRDKSKIVFVASLDSIFAVAKYRKTMEKVVERKGIETIFKHHLVEIRPDKHEAVIESLDTREQTVLHYDLLHVTPPMSAPKFLAESPLAGEGGWVDVDKYTLQHKRYANVFALGDCSSLPTSKTGAAIRKQAPVVVANVKSAMAGQPLAAQYDGYTSCPLVTGYGKLVLAEFDYNKEPEETFPFDQSKERWTMWALKKYFLPKMYWHGMLKGRA